MFDKAYWEQRYREGGHHHADPSPHLVAAVADLAPGTALDAGCGEGANAAWLAGQGWRVTAVDISETALARARARQPDVDWVQADLTGWTPRAEAFDLVVALYVHPAGPQSDLHRKLAAAVAPGGTLLVVGHDSTDHHALPETHATADDVVAVLDPDRWEVVVAESRAGRHGHGDVITIARRRA
ncbi:class I SAM-dependent methyltransferase [Actinokineospora sp. NPDC004072]